MPAEITCPKCGQSIRVPTSYAGKRIKCPQCQVRFHIPGGSRESATSWYLKKSDGTQYGPVARDVLDRWSREGRIDRQCQIRRQGSANWQQASAVYEDLPDTPARQPPGTPTLEDFDLETMTDSAARGRDQDLSLADLRLDADRSLSPDTGVVSPRIARVLTATSPITLFVAFAGFVTTGALAAVSSLRIWQSIRTDDGAAAGLAALDLVAICLLILLPSWQTFLYHRRLKEFVRVPTERQLAAVLEQGQRFWKALLLLPAVGLVYVLIRLIAAGGPSFGS